MPDTEQAQQQETVESLTFASCVVPPGDRTLQSLAADRGQTLTVPVDVTITTRDAAGHVRETQVTLPPGTLIRTVSESPFVLVGFCGDVPYPVTLTQGQWEPGRVVSAIPSSERMLRHALRMDEDAESLAALAKAAHRHYGASVPGTPCGNLSNELSLLPNLRETVRVIHARTGIVFNREISLYSASVALSHHARETRRIVLERTEKRKWKAASW